MGGKRSSTTEMRSVHKGHRIFHHRCIMVCVECGGFSMWVNGKLRRDCPWEPLILERRSLKEWRTGKPSAGASVASLCRCGAANRGGGGGDSLSVTHARSRMALCGWVGLGRGSGEDNGPIPSVGTTLPPCAACRFSRAPTEFLQFLVELPSSLRVVGQCAQRPARDCGILCV